MPTLQAHLRPTAEIEGDEHDGSAKVARLGPDGLDVERFHVLTFT